MKSEQQSVAKTQNNEIEIALFTGEHCELCDKAEHIFEQVQQSQVSFSRFHLKKYNIRKDPELYHLYALRIPVLKRVDTQDELGWPFDDMQLKQFLS
uniref:glutaredoxin family protein n=1 Tax=Ningiella ruwaisensis TaxID=2364274 RepID=UPI0010A099A0|nr:glutaredoxin family protein [Ningiella ruwaisensis]